MAESTDKNGAISVKTAFGEIAAKGSGVMLVLILFGITYLALEEHGKRSIEHHEILESLALNRDVVVEALKYNDCLNRLAIYQGFQPRGVINWGEMPTDLYPCIPKFMVDRK